MGDKLAALRVLEGRCKGDLDAELVRPVRLPPLADAFDLRRVQGIDLPAALVFALLTHPVRQPELGREDALQFRLATDLARDVAQDPAEIGPDGPQRPVGALVLPAARAPDA